MIRNLTALALLCASPAAAETLTNAGVLAMQSAGFGDEVIIAKTRASVTKFDISVEQLIALKHQGVSTPVLMAMIDAANANVVNRAKVIFPADPLAPHPAGLYMLVGAVGAGVGADPVMIKLDVVQANQAKSTGRIAFLLTGGVASKVVKVVVPQSAARFRTSAKVPVFYLYTAPNSGTATIAGLGGGVVPTEFSLIHLSAKRSRREIPVASFGLNGSKAGVMDDDRIAFSYDQVDDGVFRMTPTAPLSPGEYGFLFDLQDGAGGKSLNGALKTRVFDFAVDPAPKG
ncbi:hypothetical protein SPAN111604_11510 [Sphingomonas antarctica]|uniref:hypothetical protein n=1 Tax=Sphingomonas antarctica TaxID=2040274 RepID=UPI0039E94BC1